MRSSACSFSRHIRHLQDGASCSKKFTGFRIFAVGGLVLFQNTFRCNDCLRMRSGADVAKGGAHATPETSCRHELRHIPTTSPWRIGGISVYFKDKTR